MLTGPALEQAVEVVNTHLEAKYQDTALMTDAEKAQLAWNIHSTTTTSEKDVAKKVEPTVEVKRCSSRLYNLNLLLKGDSTHPDFVMPQEKDNKYSLPLTKDDYVILRERFKGYDKLKIDTLRVATVISSTYSKTAKDQADKVLGKDKWSIDSVEFYADAFHDFSKAREIFPLVEELLKQYPAAEDQKRIQGYLQTAFAHATHYRHMLYTEGSSKMFRQLLKEVKEGKVTADTLNFMICYWTINITGFRAQADPIELKGSSYLTHNTFRAMRALEKQLHRAVSDSTVNESDLLNSYLDLRAEFLELDSLQKRGKVLQNISLTKDERRFLAHIGASMRLFHPEEGGVLALGFSRIPDDFKSDYMQSYFDYELATPTYGPSVFQNAVDFRMKVYDAMFMQKVNKGNYTSDVVDHADSAKRLLAIADVVVGILPCYFDMIIKHQEQVQVGERSDKIPLNFNPVAFNEQIVKFCASSPILDQKYDIFNELYFECDAEAKVTAKILPLMQAKAAEAAAASAADAAMVASKAAKEASEAAFTASVTYTPGRRKVVVKPEPAGTDAQDRDKDKDKTKASITAKA